MTYILFKDNTYSKVIKTGGYKDQLYYLLEDGRRVDFEDLYKVQEIQDESKLPSKRAKAEPSVENEGCS